MEPLIVAIDGPSNVGKTTTSRLVAGKLSIPHIDTGAMYRAIALKAS
jgi:CMP/dCMP kinase